MSRKIVVTIAALAVIAIVAGLSLITTPAVASVAVGEEAPGFALEDLTGNTHSLEEYAGKTVVLEWINPNCPFSDRHAREKTMIELADRYGEVVWLAINSTSPDHRDFLSPAEHASWAEKRGIDYAILYDRSGEVGRAYGARTTPHMYIIDEEGTLLYDGAIDDDPPGRQEPGQRMNYVHAGLDAVASGNAPDPATTKPYGCSVKY